MLGRAALVSMKRRIKVQVRCATAKEAKRFAEDNLSHLPQQLSKLNACAGLLHQRHHCLKRKLQLSTIFRLKTLLSKS